MYITNVILLVVREEHSTRGKKTIPYQTILQYVVNHESSKAASGRVRYNDEARGHQHFDLAVLLQTSRKKEL